MLHLTQCWLFINQILWNKCQQSFNPNTLIFLQENSKSVSKIQPTCSTSLELLDPGHYTVVVDMRATMLEQCQRNGQRILCNNFVIKAIIWKKLFVLVDFMVTWTTRNGWKGPWWKILVTKKSHSELFNLKCNKEIHFSQNCPAQYPLFTEIYTRW